MPTFTMAKSLEGTCTICGFLVKDGQTFVWLSHDDQKAGQPTHRLCSETQKRHRDRYAAQLGG